MMPLVPFVVVQITDTHLFADPDRGLLGLTTIESFRAVLAQVQQLPRQPDLLLLTGDLSQDGSVLSYTRLQDLLLPLAVPTYWLPGNHDRLPVMQQVLQQPPISAEKSFQAGEWQFILLNSQVVNQVHGCLAPDSLNWLEQQLQANPTAPTLVALHHPPYALGSDWLDGSALQNPEDLFAVLDRHSQVKLVLSGHVHQEYSRQRHGVQYFGTPSTCIQFEPESTAFALDSAQPGFRILYLYPNGESWTKVERASYAQQLDLAAKGY